MSPNEPFGHPFAGYYLPYPDTNCSGLVSTICEYPPIMNWIYIDRDTDAVKYGVRANAQPNLTWPFDCTRQEHRLKFAGWEGFCAVWLPPGAVNRSGCYGGGGDGIESIGTSPIDYTYGYAAAANGQGYWALYFDVHGNKLKGKVPDGTPILEVLLRREERSVQPERPEPEVDMGSGGSQPKDNSADPENPERAGMGAFAALDYTYASNTPPVADRVGDFQANSAGGS